MTTATKSVSQALSVVIICNKNILKHSVLLVAARHNQIAIQMMSERSYVTNNGFQARISSFVCYFRSHSARLKLHLLVDLSEGLKDHGEVRLDSAPPLHDISVPIPT